MQTNGGASESTTGVGDVNNGSDQLSDIAPNSITTSQTGSCSANQTQSQPQQQQQLRASMSPGHQQNHLHQSSLGFQSGPNSVLPSQGVGSPTNQVSHHLVPQPVGYHQRHAQSYHNQQHQTRHYHHQQNKYNSPRGDNESKVNHVLLITVINPHYTITCDLIHQICSTYGKVNRIVIFKKNGVQAMVEFDNVESAKRAKSMLNGCDIYSGCCTLRIEYAKPTRLNIHKNDNDSFDYTNPNFVGGHGDASSGLSEHGHHQSLPNATSQQQGRHQSHQQPSHGHHSRGGGGRSSIVGAHTQHHGPQLFHPSHHHHSQSNAPHHQVQSQIPVTSAQQGPNYHGMNTSLDQPQPTTNDAFHSGGINFSRGGPPTAYVDPYLPTHGGPHSSMYPRHEGHQHSHQHHHRPAPIGGGHNHNSTFSTANPSSTLMTSSNLTSSQGTVMMVYGLQPDRVNCDRLFNLFCLYGNVVRVKFLRSKEGCAMVQMGDVLAVDRCVSSLNKITLFGNELQISYSKQAFLHDVMQPYILPDGSPSFKDFMGNKNNRFKNPEVASKNRILPPSQVLHFFNAPLGITEDELVHLFKQTAGHEPITVKIFTPKSDNTKSFSGLVTFKDPAEATEALILCNHLNMPKPGSDHPYILRLCFSPPTYLRPPSYLPATTGQ